MATKLDIKRIERISKALGDPYRIKIIEAVKKQKGWTQCADVVELIDLSQSTVSHHVNLLVDAGLIVTEKEGRNLKLQLNREVFSAYIRYLSDFQA